MSVVMPPLQIGAPHPIVVLGQAALTKVSVRPWVPESGTRHPGMEGVLEGVWPGGRGSVCVSRSKPLSATHFSLTHPAPLGLDAMV